MQKLTAHKVPTVAEKDKLPDFNVLHQNFIENLLPAQENHGEDKQHENSDEQFSKPEARGNISTQKRKKSIVVLEDKEIEELEITQAAKNTVKRTECAVRPLSSWYLERYGKEIKLTDLKKDDATELLRHFFLEIRNTRKETVGAEYEPLTLTAYRNGLRRYFLEWREGEKFDIGDDANLTKKLCAKRKQLKAAGKGSRPNKADPFDENQIEKLWSSGAVGIQNPRQLLLLVWWNNIIMLGMRGRQEQLECRVDDFHDHGSYFEYIERTTKTRTGEYDATKARRKYNNKIFRGYGGERDLYFALKTYISHRPDGVEAFYLQPIENPKNNVWYKRLALKRDGLGNIMKKMSQQAGIENEGRFTNTSGRKTAVQSLRGFFDPVEILELTGHANPSSIQSYSHNSLQKQQEICSRLAGSSANVQNNTTTIVSVSKDGVQQTLSSIFNFSTLKSGCL